MTTPLTIDTFDAPARALNLPLPSDPPEGGWTWPPTSVTLIAGEHDAVLVDTLPTFEDSAKLADWIEASGKTLIAIYITHGHLDHFIGIQELLSRFPNTPLYATEATVSLVEAERANGVETSTYAPLFVDEIATDVVVPEILTAGRITLEGHEMIAVEAGQSDVNHSSYLHIPSLDAVIVGDIAYNDVHPTLIGSDRDTRSAWIETLEELQRLDPAVVVASHRRADAPNGAHTLAATIEYLEDANRLLETDPSASEFIDGMLAKHSGRENVTTLMFGAAALGLV